MRFYPVGLVLSVALAACADPAREDVISRFDGGEKRVVAIYRGAGTDERLVTRQTFDIRGTLLLVEDLENGTRKTYGELNPQHHSAAGLAEFVRGMWYEHKHSQPGDTLNLKERGVYLFGISTLSIESSFSLDDEEESLSTSEQPIVYRDALRIEISLPQEELVAQLKKDEPKPESVFAAIEISDPETMLIHYIARYSDVEIPMPSISKLHRSEAVSLDDAVAWGVEHDTRLEGLSAERNALIEAHYPLWAVNIKASSDRVAREYEITSETNTREFAERAKAAGSIDEIARRLSEESFENIYGFRPGQDISEAFAARAAKQAAERAAPLRALLQRLRLSPDQYRAATEMTDMEFLDLYGTSPTDL